MEIDLTETASRSGHGKGMTGSQVAGMMMAHTIKGFDIERLAAAGQITGVKTIQKFGANFTLSTTRQDIHSQGGVLAHPTVAGKVKVISSNVGDNQAGLGARTIHIAGVDGSYNYIHEDLLTHATDGTILGPESVNDYLFVYVARVTSRGALLGYNLGDIDVEFTGASGTSICRLPLVNLGIGAGASMTTHYVVPAGKIAFVHPLAVTIETNKVVDFAFHLLSAPTSLTTPPYDGVNFLPICRSTKSGGHIVDEGIPFFISEKMHVWTSAMVDTGTAFIFARYDVLEMDAF